MIAYRHPELVSGSIFVMSHWLRHLARPRNKCGATHLDRHVASLLAMTTGG